MCVRVPPSSVWACPRCPLQATLEILNRSEFERHRSRLQVAHVLAQLYGFIEPYTLKAVQNTQTLAGRPSQMTRVPQSGAMVVHPRALDEITLSRGHTAANASYAMSGTSVCRATRHARAHMRPYLLRIQPTPLLRSSHNVCSAPLSLPPTPIPPEDLPATSPRPQIGSPARRHALRVGSASMRDTNLPSATAKAARARWPRRARWPACSDRPGELLDVDIEVACHALASGRPESRHLSYRLDLCEAIRPPLRHLAGGREDIGW